MNVWVDITAPAHVLVFRPLIAILRERGDTVEVTARSCRIAISGRNTSTCAGAVMSIQTFTTV